MPRILSHPEQIERLQRGGDGERPARAPLPGIAAYIPESSSRPFPSDSSRLSFTLGFIEGVALGIEDGRYSIGEVSNALFWLIEKVSPPRGAAIAGLEAGRTYTGGPGTGALECARCWLWVTNLTDVRFRPGYGWLCGECDRAPVCARCHGVNAHTNTSICDGCLVEDERRQGYSS